jgi:hypothetical protein
MPCRRNQTLVQPQWLVSPVQGRILLGGNPRLAAKFARSWLGCPTGARSRRLRRISTSGRSCVTRRRSGPCWPDFGLQEESPTTRTRPRPAWARTPAGRCTLGRGLVRCTAGPLCQRSLRTAEVSAKERRPSFSRPQMHAGMPEATSTDHLLHFHRIGDALCRGPRFRPICQPKSGRRSQPLSRAGTRLPGCAWSSSCCRSPLTAGWHGSCCTVIRRGLDVGWRFNRTRLDMNTAGDRTPTAAGCVSTTSRFRGQR